MATGSNPRITGSGAISRLRRLRSGSRLFGMTKQMPTRSVIRLISAGIFMAGSLYAQGGGQAEFRRWTSADGTQTVVGRVFRTTPTDVTLVLDNGRSQTIKRDFMSAADLEWLDKNANKPAKTDDPKRGGSSATAKIPSKLDGILVDQRGNPASVTNGDSAPGCYLFYYSASWCPPCRAFTPDLVRFERQMRDQGVGLAVILVPSDKTRDGMLNYMREARMPWPAVDFDKKSGADIPKNSYGAIPAMVVVDADGKVIAESSKQTSRDKVLAATKDFLQRGSETAER